jgi:hypothetical protein
MVRRYETSKTFTRSAEAHRVYVKKKWLDDWEEVKHLYCDWLTIVAGPSISSAAFRWRHGVGMRPGEAAFATVDKLDKLRHFVKVEIDQADDEEGNPQEPIRWFGWLDEEERMPDGVVAHAGATTPTGEQALLAYGLESILDRQEITTCWYLDVTAPNNPKEIQIGRALEANGENRLDDRGNRSKDLGANETYLFAGNLAKDQCAYWSTKTLLEYLVAYHAPTDAAGNPVIRLKLHDTAGRYLPDWDKPTVQLHGRSLKQLLDELLDRRRLLGYTLEVEETGTVDGDFIVVRPFTYADIDINLPSGNVFPSNDEQVEWVFDTAIDVERPTIRGSASQAFDQVVVTAGRIFCCGTISAKDGTLVAHWRPEEQTAYTREPEDFGVHPLDPDDRALREQRMRDYRASDRLARVFAYFGLPPTWDGKVKDGEEGTPHDLFPFTELGLDPEADGVWYIPDLRFAHTLPLKDDDTTPDRLKWEYRKPLVLLKVKEPAARENTYAEVDKLAAAAGIEECGAGAGRNWGCSVRVQPDAPGLILRVHGAEQYAIASEDFPVIMSTVLMENFGSFDWHDNLLATVALRADRMLEVAYPEEVTADVDVVRRLRIDGSRLDASKRAELWWIAPGTVTSVEDGKLQRAYPEGKLLRDDRPLLRDLARQAYEWYARPRQTISVTYRQLLGIFSIGDLVVQVGYGDTVEPIRSVVTSVRIDLAQREGETHRTSVATQWGELDVLRLL